VNPLNDDEEYGALLSLGNIVQKLKIELSPEPISNRLPLKYPGLYISNEVIYQSIYDKSTRAEHNIVLYHARRSQ